MERRTFLTTVGSSVLLAGCSGEAGKDDTGPGEAESTRADTATATEQPTPTATPKPAPEIESLDLVVHWTDEADDPVGQHVTSTTPETPTWLSYSYQAPVHDGDVDVEHVLEFLDENDEVVHEVTDTGEQSVSASKSSVEDSSLTGIPPGKLSTGTYTARLTIEDSLGRTTSDPATETVELVEPLEADEVHFTYDGYDLVDGWENVAMTWTARNTGDRDSGVVTGLSVKAAGAPDRHYTEISGTIGFDVPADASRTYRLEDWNFEVFEDVDEVTFRFDDYSFEWTVPVREEATE